ncbi:MAG: transporter permease [Bacteroidetes bacterium]|nr:transporter permease [Bacteroidota bacterium]
MFKATISLFRKDLLIEFRNRYVLGGIALYVLSSVMVIYFSLNYSDGLKEVNPVVWSIFFWLIILFSSINAIANGFFREPAGRSYYYYYLASPQAVILSKLLYNFIFTVLLILLAFSVFIVMIGDPVRNLPLFLLTALLGGTGYSFLFTLMGAIAARAGNNATLIAVLGFPIIIPILIFITKLSAASMGSTEFSQEVVTNLILLSSFNVMQLLLAYILFPYIWRE